MSKLKNVTFSNFGVISVSRGGSELLVGSHMSRGKARRTALRQALATNFCRVVDLANNGKTVEMAWVPKGHRCAITTLELAQAETRTANHPK